MRLPSITWLLPSLAHHALASALDSAHPTAYLFDTHSTLQATDADSSLINKVHPTTAFSIFAQRLGLSRFYDVGMLGHDEERQIELLGGPRSLIFGDDSAERMSKVFVTVEGSKDIFSSLLDLLDVNAYFHVKGMPVETEVDGIVAELRSKAKRMEKMDDTDYAHVKGFDGFSWRHGNDISRNAGRTIIQIKSLSYTANTYGTDSKEYLSELSSVHKALQYLQRNPDTHTTTVLCLPPYTATKNSKRSEWALHKRDEAPIISPVPSISPVSSSDGEDDSPVNVDPAGFFPAKFGPLADSAIPARWQSKAGCETGTRNCTAHGSCGIVAKEQRPDRTVEYWGCVCKPHTADRKTTYFAGNACQKVDVSGSFWLLAGVTVGLVSVVSMGIGLLYSVGSEELPSVIGAGVSSVRK